MSQAHSLGTFTTNTTGNAVSMRGQSTHGGSFVGSGTGTGALQASPNNRDWYPVIQLASAVGAGTAASLAVSAATAMMIIGGEHEYFRVVTTGVTGSATFWFIPNSAH